MTSQTTPDQEDEGRASIGFTPRWLVLTVLLGGGRRTVSPADAHG